MRCVILLSGITIGLLNFHSRTSFCNQRHFTDGLQRWPQSHICPSSRKYKKNREIVISRLVNELSMQSVWRSGDILIAVGRCGVSPHQPQKTDGCWHNGSARVNIGAHTQSAVDFNGVQCDETRPPIFYYIYAGGAPWLSHLLCTKICSGGGALSVPKVIKVGIIKVYACT